MPKPDTRTIMAYSVAELQAENVAFELECTDRMYLNCYVPQLTSAGGVASYFRNYKGHKFASTKDAVETSAAFRRNVFAFAKEHDIPIHRFVKGQRKDEVMHGFLKDFGPFFLKFCSYFPYTGKLCINGHEYLKRQLAKRGILFEDLDNGLLSCEEPRTAQRLADGFNEHKIERFLRKWLQILDYSEVAPTIVAEGMERRIDQKARAGELVLDFGDEVAVGEGKPGLGWPGSRVLRRRVPPGHPRKERVPFNITKKRRGAIDGQSPRVVVWFPTEFA